MQHTSSAIYRLGSGEHLVWYGRGKNGSRAGSIEHAKTNKATMHRLVATTTTRNNPYFSLNRGILAHDDLLLNIYADKVRMSGQHAGKRLLDDIIWFIDQFLHIAFYPFFGDIEILPITCCCSTASCCCTAERKVSLNNCCCSGDQLCSLAISETTSSRAPRPRWRSSSMIEVRRASTS